MQQEGNKHATKSSLTSLHIILLVLCECIDVYDMYGCVVIICVVAFVVGENASRETKRYFSGKHVALFAINCRLHFTFHILARQHCACMCMGVCVCVCMCMLLSTTVATTTNGKITFDATLSMQFANSLHHRELSRQLQQQPTKQATTIMTNKKNSNYTSYLLA